MLTVTNHQGKANQNHNTLPCTHQDGYYKKKIIITHVDKGVEKIEPLCSGGENVNGAAGMEKSMVAPQKKKFKIYCFMGAEFSFAR